MANNGFENLCLPLSESLVALFHNIYPSVLVSDYRITIDVDTNKSILKQQTRDIKENYTKDMRKSYSWRQNYDLISVLQPFYSIDSDVI